MSRRPRRNHTPAFKARVAIAALKGEKTLLELSQEFDLPPNQIQKWRDQLLSGASRVFDAKAAQPEPTIDLKSLHAKIGEQVLAFELEEAGVLEASRNIDRLRLVVEESGSLTGLDLSATQQGPFQALHISCHGTIDKE